MKFLKKRKYRIVQFLAKYSFVFVIFVSILMTNMVFAEPSTSPNANTDPVQSATNTTIDNPLDPKYSDIGSFVEGILRVVLVVGVPIVALSIIYSGFLFLKAQGEAKGLETAKKAFLYSIIGAVLLLGALILAEAIQKTVDEIKRNA